MKRENIALWLSILALTVSIASVAFRFNPLNFDYLNFVVVVIATAVAVFVGCQVYQAFTLKTDINRINDALYEKMVQENQKQVDRLKNEVDNAIESRVRDYDHTVSAAIYEVHSVSLLYGKSDYYYTLFYLMESMSEINKTPNKKQLDGVLSYIEHLNERKFPINLTKEEVIKYTKTLGISGDSKAIELIPYIQSLEDGRVK